jgi:hypothetical protein
LYQFYLLNQEPDNFRFICLNDEIRKYFQDDWFFFQQRDRLADTRLGFEETLTILDNERMLGCYSSLFTKYNINFLMFGVSWDRCTPQHIKLIEETDCIKFLCTINSESGPIARGLPIPKLNKVLT